TQELVKMEEVRRHRGELSRMLKSLNEAYDHLRRLNEELARARQVAEEARRLKAEFATNLSHELRTPLNLIIGFSELMVTAPHLYGDQPVSIPLSGALRRDLDAIHRNAQHLSSLLDDILDLGQIEAGKVGLYKERLPLADVAAEAAAVVEKLFEARGLGLTVTVPADLPSPYADRTRVRQILINLLNNAARFTDRGGVSIRAWASDSDVVVATEDTGIGIAPPDIPRVFEEFHQLGSPDRPAQGGRGLGLAICRHLVELHGGSIWAESEVGRGTTFFFSLPIHEAVVPLTEAATRHRWLRAAQSGDTEARTVVAVAEDPAIQRLFARHLGGYRVVGVPTWEQACELASADPVRAFVVATATPRECLAAVERLPERGYQAPVAICSLPTRQALAQRLGAAAYLTKPVSRAQVEDVLSSLGLRIRRVLVVDDDPEMARLLADMIRSFGRGHRVGLASGGAEALALLRERRYDVVLLDIRMPDIDGQTVLQQMRADEKLRKIPVVVVTAMFGQDAVPNAGTLAITRWPGLSAEELTRCLQASLDSLIETAPSTAGALPATPAGSPAWSETPPLPAAVPGRAV
ncbi:MAG: response regulator, partial [Chloroflexi bacterium]|nr:response regulator [Chloroflexota bacterium]